jgi:hypothetical protein
VGGAAGQGVSATNAAGHKVLARNEVESGVSVPVAGQRQAVAAGQGVSAMNSAAGHKVPASDAAGDGSARTGTAGQEGASAMRAAGRVGSAKTSGRKGREAAGAKQVGKNLGSWARNKQLRADNFAKGLVQKGGGRAKLQERRGGVRGGSTWADAVRGKEHSPTDGGPSVDARQMAPTAEVKVPLLHQAVAFATAVAAACDASDARMLTFEARVGVVEAALEEGSDDRVLALVSRVGALESALAEGMAASTIRVQALESALAALVMSLTAVNHLRHASDSQILRLANQVRGLEAVLVNQIRELEEVRASQKRQLEQVQDGIEGVRSLGEALGAARKNAEELRSCMEAEREATETRVRKVEEEMKLSAAARDEMLGVYLSLCSDMEIGQRQSELRVQLDLKLRPTWRETAELHSSWAVREQEQSDVQLDYVITLRDNLTCLKKELGNLRFSLQAVQEQASDSRAQARYEVEQESSQRGKQLVEVEWRCAERFRRCDLR